MGFKVATFGVQVGDNIDLKPLNPKACTSWDLGNMGWCKGSSRHRKLSTRPSNRGLGFRDISGYYGIRRDVKRHFRGPGDLKHEGLRRF